MKVSTRTSCRSIDLMGAAASSTTTCKHEGARHHPSIRNKSGKASKLCTCPVNGSVMGQWLR
jgi:hypothetical protein